MNDLSFKGLTIVTGLWMKLKVCTLCLWISKQKRKGLQMQALKDCTPDWNRTSNLQLRRLLLYPIELRAQKNAK